MAPKLTRTLSTFLFIISILFNFLGSTMQDEPCPYPCYPPPTGTGTGSTPTTGTPPPPVTLPPPSQSGFYPPPAGYYNPTTPTGNLPNNYPSPPYNGYGNPPPDPILPYFPYYYRKPPHKTEDQSSATSLGRSILMIAAANAFLFLFFLLPVHVLR